MQLIRICDILHYPRIEGRVLHLQTKRDTDNYSYYYHKVVHYCNQW